MAIPSNALGPVSRSLLDMSSAVKGLVWGGDCESMLSPALRNSLYSSTTAPTTNVHSRRATRGERILLDHLVKNIKEGKDKQPSGGKKDSPRDKADTIYMVQSWQRRTKQKVSQKFSHGSGISFPTLTADNAVVEPLTIEMGASTVAPGTLRSGVGANTSVLSTSGCSNTSSIVRPAVLSNSGS
ncbi:hypothetical protein Tco_0898712 [Tanacetum coccineum]